MTTGAKMRRAMIGVVCSAMMVGSVGAGGQALTPDYRAAARALGARTIATGAVTIDRIELGRMAPDTNRFTARVTNRGDAPQAIGLSLRTVPGLWVRANWQRGYRIEVAPHSERVIDVPYVFRRMTPEARLRVAFGTARDDAGGIDVVERYFDTTLAVGRGNPAVRDPRTQFDTLSTAHFEIFAWKRSASARALAAIAAGRERALTRIAEMMGVPFSGKIQLVFYPDSASKTSQTGHMGNGFADGRTIVEIFNDSVQLDPYHEVAHIVAGERGSPSAMFDEGFAVYASELLGADALQYLGGAGRKVSQVVCGYQRSGDLFPLARLIRFTDIGSDSTRPGVSYPQAASVVAFLIERYGVERFRDVYARLKGSTDPAEQRRNEETLRATYGVGVAEIEREWKGWLRCGAQRRDQ